MLPGTRAGMAAQALDISCNGGQQKADCAPDRSSAQSWQQHVIWAALKCNLYISNALNLLVWHVKPTLWMSSRSEHSLRSCHLLCC